MVHAVSLIYEQSLLQPLMDAYLNAKLIKHVCTFNPGVCLHSQALWPDVGHAPALLKLPKLPVCLCLFK